MKFGKTLDRNQIPEWSRHYLSYKGLKKEIKSSVEALASGESTHADIVTGFLFHLDREVEKVNGFFVYKRAELERRLRILSEKARKVADINSMALSGLRITDGSTPPAVAALGSPAAANSPALSIVTSKYALAAASTNKNPAAVATAAPTAPATALPGVVATGSAATPLVPPSPFISDPEADAECLKAIVDTKEMISKLTWFAEMNRRAIEKILKKFDKNVSTVCKDDYLATKANLQPFVLDSRLHDLTFKTNILYNEVSAVVSDLPPPALRNRSSRLEARMGLTDDEITQALTAIDQDDADTLRYIIDTKINSSTIFKNSLDQAQKGQVGHLPKSFFRRACQRLSFKCVALLMMFGAGRLIVNINEQTILHKLAIEGGQLALTQDNMDMLSEATPLASEEEAASKHDDPTLIEFILRELSSTTYTDSVCTLKSTADISGRRPLHYAAMYGFPRIAMALLKDLQSSGEFVDFSSPYWLDSDGFSPVIYAVTRGHAEVLDVLINQGRISDVDTITSVGGTLTPMPKVLPSTPMMVLNPLAGSEFNIHAAYTYTPLSIACRLGYTDVVKLLIHHRARLDTQDEDGESCLIVAAKNGHVECVKLLIEGGADLEQQERYYGWTALHMAAIENHPETVRILLSAGANPNVYDFSSWTPHEHAVFAANNACAALLRPVTLSLDERQRLSKDTLATSSQSITTAADGDSSPTESVNKSAFTVVPVSPQVLTPMSTAATNGSTPRLTSAPSPSNSSGRSSPPIGSRPSVKASKTTVQRAYGHKYLVDESLIVVTLGSNDIRNTVEPIELHLSGTENHFLTASTAYSLEIRAENTTAGEKAIVDLPIKDSWHEPIAFYTRNPEETILHFSVYPTFAGGPMHKMVGRGTALLSSLDNLRRDNRSQHPHMTPLHGMNMTVPIFSTENMQIIGRVRVELTVVRPFKHENLNVGSKHTYWKSLTTTVIGHRGLGMNRRVPNLQVGENTLLSFVTASSLGAEYVEFDVQMTKDMVPVLYHDWTVTETGLDIPVSAMTVDQFQKLSKTNRGHDGKGGTHPSPSRPGSPRSDSSGAHTPSVFAADNMRLQAPGRPSLSRSPSSTSETDNMSNGMLSKESSPHSTRLIRSNSLSAIRKHELQCKAQPRAIDLSSKMKGNSAETIQAPFATLKDTFETVPAHTGFNIEVKYPMLDEAEEANIPLYCHEMNLFVDRILQEVYDHDKTHPDRKIIFSSFHPDICLLLNLKQPNYPVFFLTDGGTSVMADRRCNSLQEAVRFATSIDLLGIVTASQPIIEAPNLVKGIKQTGLLVFTYGSDNNEIENAKLQRRHGVDAVIVDCVLAVRKGLATED
ncbi:Glycerophosphocholine phosphodiesterase [Actinomortierella ambigua]|uniref:Glycerophosphocholine phosphodiesterase n=1 Tax=Actinomortierella ambigua TaxID=1343610 RepID=A0A9P6UBE8_9FUNG|nr:Glycerophosphocholine phosphodiesterase [Actinomortierella ambigua]